uniref:Uncharacterized protein n=1 Tax=Mycena chlorophos TaxID=658473 RepID=A0ABQ0LD45_MYCCL|nr:predicted protein [Mycena chlorophos]
MASPSSSVGPSDNTSSAATLRRTTSTAAQMDGERVCWGRASARDKTFKEAYTALLLSIYLHPFPASTPTPIPASTLTPIPAPTHAHTHPRAHPPTTVSESNTAVPGAWRCNREYTNTALEQFLVDGCLGQTRLQLQPQHWHAGGLAITIHRSSWDQSSVARAYIVGLAAAPHAREGTLRVHVASGSGAGRLASNDSKDLRHFGVELPGSHSGACDDAGECRDVAGHLEGYEEAESSSTTIYLWRCIKTKCLQLSRETHMIPDNLDLDCHPRTEFDALPHSVDLSLVSRQKWSDRGIDPNREKWTRPGKPSHGRRRRVFHTRLTEADSESLTNIPPSQASSLAPDIGTHLLSDNDNR